MPNEITAEMLAREMCRAEGNDPDDMIADGAPAFVWYLKTAETHLLATRALASLQAERANARKFDPGTPILDEAGKLQGFKDAPERVRGWMSTDGDVTANKDTAIGWKRRGKFKAKGWFTPDTKGSTDD